MRGVKEVLVDLRGDGEGGLNMVKIHCLKFSKNQWNYWLKSVKLVMVAHAFNPSIQMWISESSVPAWSGGWAPSQQGLYSETLVSKIKQNRWHSKKKMLFSIKYRKEAAKHKPLFQTCLLITYQPASPQTTQVSRQSHQNLYQNYPKEWLGRWLSG